MTSDQAQGFGYLIVRVTTARGSIPLEGARVNVRDNSVASVPDRGAILYSLVTDSSGNTERIALPAPPRSASTSPGSTKPYASYNLEVWQEGYYAHQYLGVPIFEGITAVQQADLIPALEDGTPNGASLDEELYFRTTESQGRL